MRKSTLTSRQLAKRVAEFASDKKAEDIIVLDMRKLVNFCDYFVICSATSNRHASAIADGIEDGLDDMGVSAKANKAAHESNWIVYDMGDVVAHVFEKDVRDFYSLEYLWRDAKRLKWEG